MKKARLQEISLVVVSVVISFVLAELIVRQFGVRPHEANIERHEFDQVLGWRTKKNHSTYISRRSYAHFLYYNGDGFPSGKNDVDEHASRDQPSIALIGDSFVEGAYLPFEKSLASVLDGKTSKQVLNLGVDGYGPAQYLLAARKQLPEFTVEDIVVFLFPHNDMPYVHSDRYHGYAKPLISIPEFEPVNTPLEDLKGNNNDRGLVLRVLDELALWSLVKPLFGLVVQGGDTGIETELVNTQEMNKALRLIGRIHDEFPDPTFHVYYIPELSELENKEVLEHNTEMFLRICSELQLNCVTASPFSDHPARELYIPIDRHFSELGARLVANQIYELLEKQK